MIKEIEVYKHIEKEIKEMRKSCLSLMELIIDLDDKLKALISEKLVEEIKTDVNNQIL